MSKAVAPGQHGAVSQSYVYTKLSDLNVQSTRTNIWGVVKFFKEPQRSRGTDYFQMFSIVDDSLDPNDVTAKLVCVMFNTDLKFFPKIRRVGDLIRLHRVNIKPYTQQGGQGGGPAHPLSSLQAVSSFGFSWVTIDGDPNAEIKPCSNSQEFTFSDADRARAAELRNWYVRNHVPDQWPQSPQKKHQQPATSNANTVLPSQPQSTQQITDSVRWIESVGLNNYFDVPVLLIGSGVKASDRMVLFVTDGSTLQEAHRTLPPFAAVDHSELTDVKIDQKLYDLFTGFMVPIVIFDDHCQTAQTLRPGDFVLLKNLHCTAAKPSGLVGASLMMMTPSVELVLHGKTHFGRGVRKMAADEPIARRLKERIESLKILAAEAAEERVMLNLVANRPDSADQSIGPFAEDLLHRQSRYHQSPPSSPRQQGASPPKMAKIASSPRTARSSNNNNNKNNNDVLGENDDEWEIVRMRDVATQTNLL